MKVKLKYWQMFYVTCIKIAKMFEMKSKNPASEY